MSNLNYISKLAPYSNNMLQMIMVQKILSYLLLINVALLVLLINDGKSSAIRFPSVTLRENGGFVLPEKVDKFGRTCSRVLADNIYYNTKEIIGGHGRSHHHSLQPGNAGRTLSEIPSGPDPIHNPDSPSARVYG